VKERVRTTDQTKKEPVQYYRKGKEIRLRKCIQQTKRIILNFNRNYVKIKVDYSNTSLQKYSITLHTFTLLRINK